MNSKERVLRSIRHEDVDRTPHFYLGTKEINIALAERLGVTPGDPEQLLARLDVDVRFVGPTLVPGNGRHWFQTGNVHAKLYGNGADDSSSQSVYPLGNCSSVDEIMAWDWPNPDWYEYKLPTKLLESYREKAVAAYDMGIIFLYAMSLRGMDGMMLDMAGDPDIAHAVFGRIAEINLERTRRILEANKGIIDIVGIGDDVAGQTGMFFSPQMWKDFIGPHVMNMVRLCEEYGVIPYFHGCGGFRDLFDYFIEMGIPCIGRLQTEAAGNNFEEVKTQFGEQLCLWGGIDGQHVLIEANEEQVREHVRDLLRIGSAGSGYIAGPTHSFTADTPIENIIAAYDVLNRQS